MCAFSRGFWRGVCCLLVVLLSTLFFIAEATGQSTTSAPPTPGTKPVNVLVWPSDLLTLYVKIQSLEKNSASLAEQVSTLQEQLSASETIQQTLSQSLADSLTRQAFLARASEKRAQDDAKAVQTARTERDLYVWLGWGGAIGGAILAGYGLLHSR